MTNNSKYKIFISESIDPSIKKEITENLQSKGFTVVDKIENNDLEVLILKDKIFSHVFFNDKNEQGKENYQQFIQNLNHYPRKK